MVPGSRCPVEWVTVAFRTGRGIWDRLLEPGGDRSPLRYSDHSNPGDGFTSPNRHGRLPPSVQTPGRQISFGLVMAVIVALAVPANRASVAETPQGTGRPNILIFLTDDQRGGIEVMPKMRGWLQARGTTYTNAFATTPLCCPSRASILSGRYAHNHGVTTNSDFRDLTLTSTTQYYLDRAGYRTGIFGKHLPSVLTAGHGPPYFDRWAIFHIPEESYTGGKWNVQGTVKTISQYATQFIGDQAQAFLSSTSSQPWFLHISPPNPHWPFTPEAKYKEAPVPPWNCNPAVFESDRSDKPPYVLKFHGTCATGQSVRIQQLRTLMSVDDLIDRVLTILQAKGELKDTLVFFLSDNGWQWSEHGLSGKRAPYLQSIQIPLFARWDGHIPAGVVDNRLVANIDIAPTALDAAGITPATRMDGRSLLSGYRRDRMLTEYWLDGPSPVPDWASLLTSGGHYVEYYNSNGTVSFREYYDRKADPWELSNLRTPPSGWASQLHADRICKGAACP
jgi:arylsulfatase A-like enzyme